MLHYMIVIAQTSQNSNTRQETSNWVMVTGNWKGPNLKMSMPPADDGHESSDQFCIMIFQKKWIIAFIWEMHF